MEITSKDPLDDCRATLALYRQRAPEQVKRIVAGFMRLSEAERQELTAYVLAGLCSDDKAMLAEWAQLKLFMAQAIRQQAGVEGMTKQ